MSRHTISYADEIFAGGALKFGANNAQRGLPIDLLVLADLGTPVVADPDRILNDQSATDSAQQATTFLAQPDVPRNLTATGTAGSNHVVTVTGRDQYRDVVVEQLTLSGTNVITGLKAFAEITQVDVAVGAAGDTFDLGIGSRLGLPYRVDNRSGFIAGIEDNNIKIVGEGVQITDNSGGTASDTIAVIGVSYLQAEVANAVASLARAVNRLVGGTFVAADSNTATSTTGDVRGTYEPAVTLDGSTVIKAIIRPQSRSDDVLAFGVAQFAG